MPGSRQQSRTRRPQDRGGERKHLRENDDLASLYREVLLEVLDSCSAAEMHDCIAVGSILSRRFAASRRVLSGVQEFRVRTVNVVQNVVRRRPGPVEVAVRTIAPEKVDLTPRFLGPVAESDRDPASFLGQTGGRRPRTCSASRACPVVRARCAARRRARKDLPRPASPSRTPCAQAARHPAPHRGREAVGQAHASRPNPACSRHGALSRQP